MNNDFSNIKKAFCQAFNMGEKSILNTNVEKIENGYKIDALLPSFKREEVDIKLTSNKLSIVAKKNTTDNSEKKMIIEDFFIYSEYSKEFVVENIDIENVNAELKDGILTIILKKNELEQKKVVIN